MSAPVTVTYFIEVLSSWCHWTEPAWGRLRQRYAGRVDFHWAVALMRPEDFPVSAGQCDWFYRRSGSHVDSPYMLNSGWFEAARAGHYEAPNWVAEASRDFVGAADERVRVGLAEAALRAGRKVGDLATAAAIAADLIGVDAGKLEAAARSEAVQARVAASTQRFFDHQLNHNAPPSSLRARLATRPPSRDYGPLLPSRPPSTPCWPMPPVTKPTPPIMAARPRPERIAALRELPRKLN